VLKLRRDARLFVGALCGIAFSLGAAMLLRQVPWATYGFKWWANTVQLLGTLVTGFGLLYAWARATRFWGRTWPRIKRWWAQLWGRPVNQVVRPAGFTGGLVGLEAEVMVGLGLDRSLPLQEQLLQVERYINTRLPQELTGLSRRIREVRRELQDADSRSQQAVAQAKAQAQAGLKELAARLDSTQALDLSWAIVGLFITAMGVFLSYWA
jgi:hypothetical protein